MSATVKSLGIDQLSVQERLDLIDEIWDSLPGSVESIRPDQIPEWHFRELAKRLDDAEVHPAEGRPYAEALDSIEADL